jgi:hypothetical protein
MPGQVTRLLCGHRHSVVDRHVAGLKVAQVRIADPFKPRPGDPGSQLELAYRPPLYLMRRVKTDGNVP